MTVTCQDGVVSTPVAGPVRTPAFSATSETETSKTSTAQTPDAGREQSAPLILIAGDQPVTRRALRRHLESAGCRVIEASSGRQAVTLMSENVAVAILDLVLPDVSAVDCLRHIRKRFPDTQVLVTSTSGATSEAVAAITQGALQYIISPVDRDELLAQVRQAIEVARMARENRNLRQAVSCPTTPVELVGSSPTMRTLRKQMEAFSQLDSTVLITGGRGTGKTTIAQWIHRNGPRAARPLVFVPCGSLPRNLVEAELFGYVREAFPGADADRPGQIEIAHGGTLLIDEIGQLPMELQERLLRFLRDRTTSRMGSSVVRRVDVRVITTTTRDLALMCRDGEFREDLFFRLNVLLLQLPNLRERSSDLSELAYEMLRRIARGHGDPPPLLTDDAMRTLRQHNWPGNMRELEDLLQQASEQAAGSIIHPKDIVIHAGAWSDSGGKSGEGMGLAGMTMAEIERCAVIETIRSTGGNKAKAARQLEVSEKTIYNKIKQYNLAGKI